jgi:hypothetical protein
MQIAFRAVQQLVFYGKLLFNGADGNLSSSIDTPKLPNRAMRSQIPLSIAWPDTRKLVKLGTFSITGWPSDPATLDKTLLFLPGQTHLGVEAAGPMLVMRNTAYPISLGQRQ